MFVNTRLIALAALVTLVAGQNPSQCIVGCSHAALGSATNKSCKAITDRCVCTDVGFQTAAGQCLQKNCTTQDQQAAKQLQNALCGNTTTNSTGGTNSTSSASQTRSSTATGSAATTSQSSAAGAQIQAGQTGLFALGVAAAGAIVGGLLI
ncbi:hypothetical protein M378DRAFT_11867 [Amanita muscaria Koide BX008]|uniref:CFEM domain-containing protein n=1 Tax=Amanita muscaria (strain Koide BX008) TaxID=946122 RepID=A0A0C2TAN0_AMAMK|nr:hypothetical protein M378DRAFT_11867 [Amanita muscaria Koide BX008]